MKKSLLLLCALMACLGVRAQHIEFDGVPVTGAVLDFTDRMREAGFKLQKKMVDDNYYVYKGTFCGYSSYVRADYTPKSHTVYRIQVTPKHIDINSYRDSLALRYGAEYESTERGYQWTLEHGAVFYVTPDEADPWVILMDGAGVQCLREEKE